MTPDEGKTKSTQLFDEFLKQPDASEILTRFFETYGFGDDIQPVVERSTFWTLVGYVLFFVVGIAFGSCAG